MNTKRFEEIVNEETDRIKNVLVKKQKEYNLDEDRLSHFKHAGAMAGWPAEKALYGYMLKHLMSITDMVNSGKKFSRDVWQEKMTDIHNYLILLLGLLEDDDMFLDPDSSLVLKPGKSLADNCIEEDKKTVDETAKKVTKRVKK